MVRNNQLAMQDPKTQYLRPPFLKQTQAEPGLAQAMQPAPDHGEQSYKGSGRLAGRKALVTGADSGIGRATAIAFAREGADVILSYLPEEEADAQEAVYFIEKEGRQAVAMPGDISNEAFCEKLATEGAETLGGLDILANIAGKQIAATDIAELSTGQFERTFAINVYAMFWLCKYALPYMPKGASIIN